MDSGILTAIITSGFGFLIVIVEVLRDKRIKKMELEHEKIKLEEAEQKQREKEEKEIERKKTEANREKRIQENAYIMSGINTICDTTNALIVAVRDGKFNGELSASQESIKDFKKKYSEFHQQIAASKIGK